MGGAEIEVLDIEPGDNSYEELRETYSELVRTADRAKIDVEHVDWLFYDLHGTHFDVGKNCYVKERLDSDTHTQPVSTEPMDEALVNSTRKILAIAIEAVRARL